MIYELDVVMTFALRKFFLKMKLEIWWTYREIEPL